MIVVGQSNPSPWQVGAHVLALGDQGTPPVDRRKQPFVVDVGGELSGVEPTLTDTPDTVTHQVTRLTLEVERLTMPG